MGQRHTQKRALVEGDKPLQVEGGIKNGKRNKNNRTT